MSQVIRAKRKLVVFILIMVFMCMAANLPVDAYGAEFSGGDGTSESPYQIASQEDLVQLAAEVNQDAAYSTDKYYVLKADINLKELGNEGWTPIGITENTAFKGNFDGNGHTISGLWTVRANLGDTAGLFGYVNNGAISNLTVEIDNSGENPGVKGSEDVGGLVGACKGSTQITSCMVYAKNSEVDAITSATSAVRYFGGLAGRIESGTKISKSFSTVNINGGSADTVGGFIGQNYGATIENCYATGNVRASSIVGGFAGDIYQKGVVNDSYATGSVTATAEYQKIAGGFSGNQTWSGKTVNCYATGRVDGSASYLNGFTGMRNSTAVFTNCYFDKEGTGQTNASYGMGATVALGLSAEEMTQKDKFSNWDFEDVWYANSGAPGLRGSAAIHPKENQTKIYDGTSPNIEYDLLTSLIDWNKETLAGSLMLENGATDAGVYPIVQGTLSLSEGTPHQLTIVPDISFKITKASRTAPVPTAEKVGADEITLSQVEDGEYSMDGLVWQDSPVFSNLQPEQSYTFYVRLKETKNYTLSEKSQPLILRTISTALTLDTKPTAAGITLGDSLSKSRLDGGVVLNAASELVDGRFIWKNPEATPDQTGIYEGNAIFIPDDESYKNLRDIEVSVAVSEKQPLDIGEMELLNPIPDYTYDGTGKEPRIQVVIANTAKGKKELLDPDTDYVVSYQDNINAGIGKIIIAGAGEYGGMVTKTFTIKPKTISSASIAGIAKQLYKGKALMPTPVVKIGAVALKKGTDYTVTYANNKAVGKAYLTVQGKGNYTGKKSASFTISPQTVTMKALRVGKGYVKADWMKVPGIQHYQIAYKTTTESKWVIKTVSSKSSSAKITELKKQKKYQVKIRAYKVSNKTKYYGSWSKVKTSSKVK